MSRVLIVGEAPGAGRREGLTRKRISELAGHPWEEWAEWRNLLADYPGSNGKGSAWNAAAARRAAEEFDVVESVDAVILLGRRVAQAFLPGGAGFPYFRWTTIQEVPAVVIPHTSGVNKWWNEAENVERAGAFLSELAERVVSHRADANARLLALQRGTYDGADE